MMYGENKKIVMPTAPVAFTTSAVTSGFVDCVEANWIQFVVGFGVMTSDSTDTVTVTVEACPIGTTTDENDEAIAFKYRLSPANTTTTDPLGAITDATATGVAVTAADDAKFLLIDIDPATIPAQVTNGRFLRVVATPSDAVAAGVIAVFALLDPRYPSNGMKATT